MTVKLWEDMDAVSVEASRQTLKDSTGNRIQLINNIQQEGWSAVTDLVSEWDIFTVKCEIMGCLERVYHGLDLIKASVKEESIVSCDQIWDDFYRNQFCWSKVVVKPQNRFVIF